MFNLIGAEMLEPYGCLWDWGAGGRILNDSIDPSSSGIKNGGSFQFNPPALFGDPASGKTTGSTPKGKFMRLILLAGI
ncbi:hypothetical protein [Hymenobacter sp. B81]|uniref:hypothetical protein n=1 Tax=Hymenobacter sp. B81 TaxID=3344878 RepID=UPI0037DDD0E2